MEIGTQSQVPTQLCTIHGEPRARLARFFSSSDLPRAELAVDVSEVAPVAVKGPTLLAETDPYNSLKLTVKPESAAESATDAVAGQKPDGANGDTGVTTGNLSGTTAANQPAGSVPEIRKAIPVQPQDQKPVEIRRAIPVKPLEQEGEDETLLKPGATPAGDE
jgi:hypothetical protein